MESYVFPAIHDFPPLFTEQPNLETRSKQQEIWCDIITAYCSTYKIYALDVPSCLDFPLFRNEKIKRRLNETSLRNILDLAVSRNIAEWDSRFLTESTSRSAPTSFSNYISIPGSFKQTEVSKRCCIYWKSLDEWASIIENWADVSGRTGSVCTFFEIQDAPLLKNVDQFIVFRALQTLEKRGRARLLSSEMGTVSIQSIEGLGVKFL